jgi:hypothetical protein
MLGHPEYVEYLKLCHKQAEKVERMEKTAKLITEFDALSEGIYQSNAWETDRANRVYYLSERIPQDCGHSAELRILQSEQLTNQENEDLHLEIRAKNATKSCIFMMESYIILSSANWHIKQIKISIGPMQRVEHSPLVKMKYHRGWMTAFFVCFVDIIRSFLFYILFLSPPITSQIGWGPT